MVALMTLLLATRWGIGTATDSAAYVQATRSLLNGKGFSLPTAGGGTSPMIQWPPLYPMMLAAGGLFHVEPLDAARWLHAFLFAANILLVGVIVRSYTNSCGWASVLSSFLTLSSLGMLQIHSTALSEPLFFLLSLLAIFLMGKYVENKRLSTLVTFCGAATLACLTRYAGVAVLATGVVAIILSSSQTRARKTGHLVVYVSISSAVVGSWIFRNLSLGKTTMNRPLVFHPMAFNDFRSCADLVSLWLLPPQIPPCVRQIIAVAAGGALLTLGFQSMRRRRRVPPEDVKLSSEKPLWLLASFIVIYVGVLVASMTFLQAAVATPERYLLPLFTTGLILAVARICGRRSTNRTAPAQALFALLMLAIAGWYSWQASNWLIQSNREGIGFSSKAWQQSETIQMVRTLPDRQVIYTNMRAPIYLHTRRVANALPRKISMITLRPNKHYALELTRIREALKAQTAIVVWFGKDRRRYLYGASRKELIDELHLVPIHALADGVIYSTSE
jgi:hypothetical protein